MNDGTGDTLSRKLTIAIDYDDTFTTSPTMWSDVIRYIQSKGHSVVCISARRNTLESRQELAAAMPKGVPVLLAYDEPKQKFALRNGYQVDIWIDDKPEAIVWER